MSSNDDDVCREYLPLASCEFAQRVTAMLSRVLPAAATISAPMPARALVSSVQRIGLTTELT